MVSSFLSLLIGMLAAFKFVALGTLVLSCIVIWVFLRMAFRALDVVSAKAFGRRRSCAERVQEVRARPACRYQQVRPVATLAPPPPRPQLAESTGRPRRPHSSSWPFWAVIGLVVAVILL